MVALSEPSETWDASAVHAATPHFDAINFDAIYEEYFDFVWRSVRQLGIGEGNADDAVQDVFMIVHRRIASFEGRSTLRSWLFGIALRVARDHRRRFRRKESRQEPLSFDLGDRAPGPHENLETSEAVRTFELLLGRLDENKREVFVLAEVEQRTAPEIAELLALPLNTVYSRLRVARQAFDQALREHEGGTHDVA